MSTLGLRVLESTAQVLQAARHVRIDRDALALHCDGWAAQPFAVPGWDSQVHWSGTPEQTCNYLLLLDALNFCFWPDPGQPRWSINHDGHEFDGYGALAVALKRAAEEGLPVTSADYLAALTEADLMHLFRGTGEIPLMDQRLANAREVGSVLQAEFGGQFGRAIEQCQGSAVALVNLLVDRFPCFRDLARYAGREVRLLKRAQITVVDVAGALGERGLGEFHDLATLTAFADYKIPQILRALGILIYSDELAVRVDARELLAAGSPEEVEIRVGMIWAVEWLRLELEARGRHYRPFELDWFLWYLSQTPHPTMRPYHRVRTIYY